MITPAQSRGSALRRPGRPAGDLLKTIIGNVLHRSEGGELPLFAWTLGMPQQALLRMLEDCSMPSAVAESIPAHEYAVLEKMVPKTFTSLRAMLFQDRTRFIDETYADCLARAIAAACFGSRQLWQDLGLNDDETLSTVLASYFHPLYQKNAQHIKWKRFLFSELYSPQRLIHSFPDMLLNSLIHRQ